ncbi:hypothetical protein [Alteribacter populi]|uniref:hypothetical protein n=1 Tax=Alteribacter populi TaxID=2011011 RepID=UPI000BBB6412|nr:hypothetical protein [Alteribacter populi]
MAETKEIVRTMIDELTEEQAEAVYEYLQELSDTEAMEKAKNKGDGVHEQDLKTKEAGVSVSDDLSYRDRKTKED